jgi:predicted lipid-binding transport protein (Tim44 family)
MNDEDASSPDPMNHPAVSGCSTWLGTLFAALFLIGLGARSILLILCGLALFGLWLLWVYHQGVLAGMRIRQDNERTM